MWVGLNYVTQVHDDGLHRQCYCLRLLRSGSLELWSENGKVQRLSSAGCSH